MALATVDSVTARMGRPLDTQEATLAITLLDDAELMLLNRVPGLLDRAETAEAYANTVTMIEANAVCRVLRNPEGYRQESEGSYNYSLDVRAAAGFLTVLADEWALLGVSATQGGAFTIRPTYPRADGRRPPEPPWRFQYGWPDGWHPDDMDPSISVVYP